LRSLSLKKRALARKGFKLTSVDLDRKAQYVAKASLKALKLDKLVTLKIMNAERLQYKDNSFDLVICSEVLEHLENPQKALRELIRVSKKYILVSVPNEPWFYLFNYTQWGKDIGHINKWSKNKFVKFIKLKSYKVISVKTPFPWTMIFFRKMN